MGARGRKKDDHQHDDCRRWLGLRDSKTIDGRRWADHQRAQVTLTRRSHWAQAKHNIISSTSTSTSSASSLFRLAATSLSYCSGRPLLLLLLLLPWRSGCFNNLDVRVMCNNNLAPSRRFAPISQSDGFRLWTLIIPLGPIETNWTAMDCIWPAERPTMRAVSGQTGRANLFRHRPLVGGRRCYKLFNLRRPSRRPTCIVRASPPPVDTSAALGEFSGEPPDGR